MSATLTPEERKKFKAFVRAIFSAEFEEDIRKDLARIAIPGTFKVRMKVLYGTADPLTVAKNLVERGRLEGLSTTGPGFCASGTTGEEQLKVTVPFCLLKTDQNQIRVLTSICSWKDWSWLKRFVGRQYPRFVPVLLSQSELVQGVKILTGESADCYEVRVREVSAREAIPGEKGKTRSLREWTHEQLQSVLAEAKSRKQLLTSIGLAFFQRAQGEVDPKPSLNAKVNNQGEVEITGHFRLAWRSVISHVAAVGSAKLDKYSGRGLKERQFKPAPLEISFKEPLLEKVETVRELGGLLSRYPHSMYVSDHANPYLRMQVADTYDGSTFEVWAVTGDSIIILPKLRASEAGLERLIHYIFETFAEGEVVEHGVH